MFYTTTKTLAVCKFLEMQHSEKLCKSELCVANVENIKYYIHHDQSQSHQTLHKNVNLGPGKGHVGGKLNKNV